MDISQYSALIKFSIVQDIFANAIFVTSLRAFHHHQTFTYSSRKKNCPHMSPYILTGAYFGANFASLTSQGTHTFTFDRC